MPECGGVGAALRWREVPECGGVAAALLWWEGPECGGVGAACAGGRGLSLVVLVLHCSRGSECGGVGAVTVVVLALLHTAFAGGAGMWWCGADNECDLLVGGLPNSPLSHYRAVAAACTLPLMCFLNFTGA